MEIIKVNEIWKDIIDFPNYQISNYGRVKSKARITNVGIKNVKEIKRKEKMEEIMDYTYMSSEERQQQNYAYDRLKELLEEK